MARENQEGEANAATYERIPSGYGARMPEPPVVEAAAGASSYVYLFGDQVRGLTAHVKDEHIHKLSILLAICGALFVVVGVIGIVLPIVFAFAVEQVIAWLLIFGGVTSLVQFCTMCGVPGTGSFLLLGILHLIIGIWMLINPSIGSLVLIYVLGGWFFANGFLKLLMACHVRNMTSWPTLLVSGMLSIALAITILVLAPRHGLVLLGVIFGVEFLTSGVGMMLFACMAYFKFHEVYVLPT
ncbi:hypothetical protein O6H91_17G035100 [Diphasiastrum complanatum]|uniref:Uncharacterized protein n=1 Tax=Diphasiastrum complanatum TaxID=34168 RepID=A0ACC2B5N3_DIPCM|nr:hypothetical protein O6H91_17G035100 [Diphasiastrum complanatum]